MSRHRTNYNRYDSPSDEDEDESVDKLHSKVKFLKEVTIQIGEETREQNRYLKGLDNQADSVLGSLSRNMDRVKVLAMSGHNRLVFYLMAFAFFVAIVVYFISKS